VATASFSKPLAAPTNVRYLILALSCAVSFVLYLHRYTWGFIKKDVRDEFGWDAVTLGWMDSWFPISYGIGQVPSGMLCDWFGARALLGSMIVLWSLSMAGTALATGLVSMALARVVFGLTQAGCYPVLSKVTKNWFPLGMRTTAQGWIATFFGRGGGATSFILFGTVLLGWLHMPWREAVGVFTAIGLLLGALVLVLFRNTPREHPWANAAEADLVTADDPEAAYASRSRLSWPALFRSKTMLFLFAHDAASNLADVLFVYWIPLYLFDVKGLDASAGGWVSSLPLWGGALSGVASGFLQSGLIRRTGNRRWARGGVGFAGKFLAAVFMLASLFAEEAVVIAGLFLVVKFFSDWGQPAEWGVITDVGGRNAATVFASVNTVGSIAGFVAGPFNGWVLQYYSGGVQVTAAGWNALFVVMALEYLAAALAWLFIDCTKPLEDPMVGGIR
jgi:sugar phosphate permease